MNQNDKAAAAKKRKNIIMIIVLIVVFILFVAPFILVVINVFKDQADITSNPLALIGEHGFTLKNFPEAMRKMDFFNVFKNSLIITVCATILTIIISAMASFVIVRNSKWKACSILFALMIASMVIPFQVLMVPLVSVYGGVFGILNSRITLILMHAGFSVSMATFMFYGAIHSNIPIELEQANRHLDRRIPGMICGSIELQASYPRLSWFRNRTENHCMSNTRKYNLHGLDREALRHIPRS